jgi:hypothetical protein
MSRFGQTQTKTPAAAADLEAMNAPAAQLPGLCAAGNALACRLAKIPQSTPEEIAERARNRDSQAQRERDAIAIRLVDAGINPSIARAARTGKDVIYAKTIEEGERAGGRRETARERAGARQEMWLVRNKNYVLTGACIFLAGTGVFLYFH